MTPTKKEVFVTATFEGMHQWPEAPIEVAFLRTLHRHIFHVKIGIAVTHSDRDVEFISCKWHLEALLKTGLKHLLLQQPAMSCEMMAQFIAEQMNVRNYRITYVEVSEDGENGARLEYSWN